MVQQSMLSVEGSRYPLKFIGGAKIGSGALRSVETAKWSLAASFEGSVVILDIPQDKRYRIYAINIHDVSLEDGVGPANNFQIDTMRVNVGSHSYLLANFGSPGEADLSVIDILGQGFVMERGWNISATVSGIAEGFGNFIPRFLIEEVQDYDQ